MLLIVEGILWVGTIGYVFTEVIEMKKYFSISFLWLAAMFFFVACSVDSSSSTNAVVQEPNPAANENSIGETPEWVTRLPEADTAKQLFVVAVYEGTTAWVSMHNKDNSGKWQMIMSTPGFIGKNGLGKTKEGDGKTPVGTFKFNRAFGNSEDPGTAFEYTRADGDTYWSGDMREGKHYNELVSLRDVPDLDKENSERIADYPIHYQYCLNISYNAEGTPGKGSAIFLHVFGDRKPFTGGCVAIPLDMMRFVMQNVSKDCVVIINSLENLGGSF